MPRKKPFSAKQKKKQLQERRIRKQEHGPSYAQDIDSGEDSGDGDKAEVENKPDTEIVDKHVAKINQQPSKAKSERYDPNKYRLHFYQESKEELARRKEKSRLPFSPLPEAEKEMEVSFDDIIDMPKRPPWDYSLSKAQVESNEERYFKQYVSDLFADNDVEKLSYFELNLETWRQLWRVLEMSDILLVITDIRHPAMHFPPALYKHITEELNKSVIIVLNKVDLAPPPLVVAWQHFFKEHFPLVDVVCFSSFPKSVQEIELQSKQALHRKRRKGTFRALGPQQLLTVCEKLVDSHVDLSSWKEKIDVDQGLSVSDSDDDDDDGGEVIHVKPDLSFQEHEKFRGGILTIGCVGYPNVGKSSLINGLMGKKVVSVSRTPGHTKHFQTIFLTSTVKLCDSPGLVFPSRIDRHLQILGGIYPIAQVREPFSTVEYLAQRLDLPKILKIKPVDEDEDSRTFKWSAMDICEAWAEKRGFLTAKAARLDAYRAANNILRLALDGRICLCLYPKGYVAKKDYWEKLKDTQVFTELQNSYRQKLQASADSDHDSDKALTDSDENNDESDNDIHDIGDAKNKTFGTSNPFALLSDDT